jgi:hypothetical protein
VCTKWRQRWRFSPVPPHARSKLPWRRPWRHGQQGKTSRRGPAQGKRAKGPTLTSLVSTHACGGAQPRKGQRPDLDLFGKRVREHERAGIKATTAGQDGGGATTTRETRKGRQNGARASVKAAAPARKVSQPGSMAGITSGGSAAEQRKRRVSPRLEGGGILRGAGGSCSHLGGHGP